MSRTLGFEARGADIGSLYHATPFVAGVLEAGLRPPDAEDPLLSRSGEVVMSAKIVAAQAQLDRAKMDGRAYPDAELSLHPQDVSDWNGIFNPERPRGVFLGNLSTVRDAYTYSSAPLGERTNMVLDMLASSRAILNKTGDTIRAKEAEELIAEYLGGAGISINSLPRHIKVGVFAVDPMAEPVRQAIHEQGLTLLGDSGDYAPMPPRGLEVQGHITPEFIRELNVGRLMPIEQTRLEGLLEVSPHSQYARLGLSLPE